MTFNDKILIEVSNEYRDINSQVQELLVKDDLKKAITLLLSFCDKQMQLKEIRVSIIVQSAFLERILTAHRRDIIDWESVNKSRNRIINNLLEILDDLEHRFSLVKEIADEQSINISKPTSTFEHTIQSNSNPTLTCQLCSNTYSSTLKCCPHCEEKEKKQLKQTFSKLAQIVQEKKQNTSTIITSGVAQKIEATISPFTN